MRFRRAAAIALTTAALALLWPPGAFAAPAPNYTDMWWNPSESGWGLSLAHHNDQMFGVLYLYDLDGSPMWVTIPGGTFSQDLATFRGDVWKTTGPSPSLSFDATRVQAAKVGVASIQFSDSNNATIDYSIGESTTRKAITRQIFGPMPSSYPFGASDLWWTPSESGWGVSVVQQGSKAFSVFFVYGSDGRPKWYVGPDSSSLVNGFSTVTKDFTWTLYETRGTPYSQPWRSSDFSIKRVGTAIFGLGLNTATSLKLFSTDIYGWPTKQLERMPFGAATSFANRVIDVTPSPGSVDISTTGPTISAQFGKSLKEPIPPSSDTAGFFVSKGGVPVSGSVQYNRSSFAGDDIYKTLQFIPAADLEPDTVYSAAIKGMKGLDGQLADDFAWSFRTAPLRSFQGSPFAIFGFSNSYYAVEGFTSSTPVIRAISDNKYRFFVASRMISSDASLKSGGQYIFSSTGGVATLAGGAVTATYRFGSMDLSTMRPVRAFSPRTLGLLERFIGIACSPDGRHCYFASNQFDQAGKLVTGSIDVVDAATGQVQRTIQRNAAAGYVGVASLVATDDAVFAGIFRADSATPAYALVKLDPSTGAELAVSPFDAQFFDGLAVNPTTKRVWTSFQPPGQTSYTLRAHDATSLQVVRERSGFGQMRALGGGLVSVPGSNKVIISGDLVTSPDLRLVDGDSLDTLATLNYSQLVPTRSEIQSVCVDSTGKRGWALLFDGPVFEFTIDNGAMSWGRRLQYEAGTAFDGNAYSNFDVIRCLN